MARSYAALHKNPPLAVGMVNDWQALQNVLLQMSQNNLGAVTLQNEKGTQRGLRINESKGVMERSDGKNGWIPMGGGTSTSDPKSLSYFSGGGGDGVVAVLHNTLPDLQGGWGNERYHFTQLHHDELGDFLDNGVSTTSGLPLHEGFVRTLYGLPSDNGAAGVSITESTTGADNAYGLRYYARSSSTSKYALLTAVIGESYSRFGIDSDGGMQWGPGSGARDTFLTRNSAGALMIASTTGPMLILRDNDSASQYTYLQETAATTMVLRKYTVGGNIDAAMYFDPLVDDTRTASILLFRATNTPNGAINFGVYWGDNTTAFAHKFLRRYYYLYDDSTRYLQIYRSTGSGGNVHIDSVAVEGGSPDSGGHIYLNYYGAADRNFYFCGGDNNILAVINGGTGDIYQNQNYSAYINYAAGSATYPTYSFYSDQNTGIYRVAADSIGISLGGTNYFTMSTTRAQFEYTDNISLVGIVHTSTTNDRYTSFLAKIILDAGDIASGFGTGYVYAFQEGSGGTENHVLGMYAVTAGTTDDEAWWSLYVHPGVAAEAEVARITHAGAFLATGGDSPIYSSLTDTDTGMGFPGAGNTLGFYCGSASAETLNLTSTTLTFADALNIAFNTTTGTKIGTATTQKLAFYNSTPIVKPSVTGTKPAAGTTLLSLLTALANLGLVTDSTT